MSHPRLSDPGEHFPYKHAHVLRLLEEDGPAGPNGPGDSSLRVSDVMSRQIADASAAMVAAQAQFLANPGDGTRAAYKAAQDALVAARQEHRARRGGGLGVSAMRGVR